MPYQPDQAPQIEKFSDATAAEAMKAFEARPDDLVAHKQVLHDARLSICQEAAALTGFQPDDELLWAFASALPEFETASLYKTRASLLALGAAVFGGWLLGGLLATLLGFLGLGGEIWRPLAILASLWLEDYLGANPRARRILLSVLGLGALARFAAALAAGMVRLGVPGGLRELLFGAGARPNILKCAWLWVGAFFLYVFFARKITGMDVASFRPELASQIAQRLNLMCLVFQELLNDRERSLALLAAEDTAGGAGCRQSDCQLARAALSLLDSLDDGKRRYLASVLERAGYRVLDNDADYLVWETAAHGDRYNTLGLVRDGDKCRILERPHQTGDQIVKGLVQRVAE